MNQCSQDWSLEELNQTSSLFQKQNQNRLLASQTRRDGAVQQEALT